MKTQSQTTDRREDVERVADGVAQALLRDYTDEARRNDAKLNDIELRMRALAQRMGMSAAEINATLNPKQP